MLKRKFIVQNYPSCLSEQGKNEKLNVLLGVRKTFFRT